MAKGLAPALSRWATAQQRRILKDGDALSASNLKFAETLGIKRPEEIRVLIVDSIPLPAPEWLVRAAARIGLPVFRPGGLALERGIFLLPGQSSSLPHELVHVLQYQRLGGTKPFMRRYVLECLTGGYGDAGLEVEARKVSGGC